MNSTCSIFVADECKSLSIGRDAEKFYVPLNVVGEIRDLLCRQVHIRQVQEFGVAIGCEVESFAVTTELRKIIRDFLSPVFGCKWGLFPKSPLDHVKVTFVRREPVIEQRLPV